MSTEEAARETAAADVRVEWLAQQAANAFRLVKPEKLAKFFEAEQTQETVGEFLDTVDARLLILTETNGTLGAHLRAPKNMRGNQLYLTKLRAGPVSMTGYLDEVIVGDMSSGSDPLRHLSRTVGEVYLPLLTNPSNQAVWSEMIAKDVMERMRNMLSALQITEGQVLGRVTLPLPPDADAEDASGAPEDEDAEVAPDVAALSQKDRVHVLEGCLITWTRQIKDVLATEPEDKLQNPALPHPGPTAEVEFWQGKSGALNSIFDQLQSERVRKVLRFLDTSKSTYNLPFAKLCKEVFHARAEANDNYKYLRPVLPWFEKLESGGSVVEMVQVFRPTLHLVLAVWKGSRFYNMPARLVVLMREICNAIIRRSMDQLPGRQIYQMYDDGDAHKVVEKLREMLKVCGEFKSAFFDYKARANNECPNNQWRVQNSALFIRYDAFLERLHDLLELSQSIVAFSKLEKIEIGGTKGKTLTTSVQHLFADFQGCVAAMRTVPYDVMDLEARAFDDDFYSFRGRMRQLESRLASVLAQAFDDCSTLTAQFQLMDAFDALVERPQIHDKLEEKHGVLIEAYTRDLAIVKGLMLDQRDEPPIGTNLPPCAGALTWCHGLQERVHNPMEKFKTLSRTVLERDEARDAIKAYTQLMGNCAEFQHIMIDAWGQTVEQSSSSKLKLPLLSRDPATGLLANNFDPALVRLLREVKYFLLLGLDVPEQALDLYRKADVFRRQTGNLDLIINMYNDVQTQMLPVERPLLKSHVTKCDNVLSKGINSLNWKSHGVDTFLAGAMGDIKGVSELLEVMKSNLKKMKTIVKGWTATPLMERPKKPCTIQDFDEMCRPILNTRYELIKQGGNKISQLLRETNKKLRISSGLPDWKSYIDFANNIVVEGLVQVLLQSLDFLAHQIDPDVIERELLSPLFNIELELSKTEVTFVPEITRQPDQSGMFDVVKARMETFFRVATIFPRLDIGEGGYIKELREHPEIRARLAGVTAYLGELQVRTQRLRDVFLDYSYLWTLNMSEMFAEFVEHAVLPAEGADEAGDAQEGEDEGEEDGSAPKAPEEPRIDLNKFDEKIRYYLDVQRAVADLDASSDICFVRVDTQPIKQALSTWVTKWIFMFTQFLSDHLVKKLETLNEFMQTVNEGLSVEEQLEQGALDEPGLMSVMGHIRDVRRVMDSTPKAFPPLRDTLALLRAHSITMEDVLIGEESVVDCLENAPMRWNNTVNHTFKIKEKIAPAQATMADSIKDDLGAFTLEISAFDAKFRADAPFGDKFTAAGMNRAEPDFPVVYQALQAQHLALAEIESKAARFNELEELFELNISSHTKLHKAREDLEVLKSVWDMRNLVEMLVSDWKRTLWEDIVTDDLAEEMRVLSGQVKKLPRQARSWPAYEELAATAANLTTVLPIVHELHSPAMRDRHWKSLSVVAGVPVDKGPDFALEDVLKLGLHNFVDDATEIVEQAAKELKIDARLQKIDKSWVGLSLEFVPYKNTDLYIIKSPDEVLEMLDEHQMQLQIMAGSGKFVEFFKDKVSYWQNMLGTIEDNLKLWLNVQRQWASLEAIFLGSADIVAQLPDESKRFEGIDADLKELMKEAQTMPVIMDACTPEGRDAVLQSMQQTLEECQKALNEYLEVKKNIFPRFYFVSNVALLDILSNGNNPPKVMPHIGDCFDALKFLELEAPGGADDDKDKDKKKEEVPNVGSVMVSKDGESVSMHAPFIISGAVEDWLNKLVAHMQDSLRQHLEDALTTAAQWETDNPREKWLFDYPAQIVLLASQIFWTEESEGALEELENGQEDAIKGYLEQCNTRLGNLILQVLGELTRQDRTKIITLITIDVHSRDLIQALDDKKVESQSSFAWQSQLRYYWEEATRDTQIRITDFQSSYAYEYIGNCGRLVITPLTDRCYITLTMALRLMLGGAPAGPAGTGKTETTKDLARGVGLPCYVFNCSDQMNYQTMGDIFKGLSQTGAWGCFDEFNRIAIEVLSVVATQVKYVLNAIVRYAVPSNREEKYQKRPAGTPPVKVGEFDFFGETIALIPTTGFWITMNPGYAGRTELPENLKALFRSCAMIRPDLKPICENMLMAEGFMKARDLAVKFVTLYQLSSELLSKQAHYDWGLRAVKSVLRVAGMLKRSADPSIDEEAILMRALRDFNTPKIPVNDTPVFLQLVTDLFPGMNLPPEVDEDLKACAVEVCKETGLQGEDVFVGKVVQYQELLDVRHSVMLLGECGTGKTTIWKALAACHNRGKTKPVTVYDTVNPKSVTSDELYGYMTLSKEWRDGCLSIIMRNMCKEWAPYTAAQTGKWVVLDGDIDAVWIESMNTVMDDNKVLTLVSNERIPLTPAMRMIFEISSLKNATPATVSRAGILYINEKDIGWRPYVDSWIARREDETERGHLTVCFDKYIQRLLNLLRANKLEHIVPRTNAAMVMSVCHLMDSLLEAGPYEKLAPVESLFVFATMWAFGGTLTADKTNSARSAFSALWRAEFQTVKIPEGGDIFDFAFSPDDPGAVFTPWSERVPSFVPMGDGDISSVIVPTVDSTRLTYLTELLVKRRRPVMFIGAAGTGKTTLAKSYLKDMDGDKMVSATINMNYYTDAKALQSQLEQPIDKRSGRTYGPQGTKKLVVLVDDLNMPFVEEYGTQTPIALLRQHMDHGSWFDRQDLGLKKLVVDVQYMACMNQKSGSFFVNPRLQRHYTSFACLMPSTSDLAMVYETILDQHLDTFPAKLQRTSSVIVTAMIELHRLVSESFLPSATKFHYNFNMREFGSVVRGLCKSSPEFYQMPIKLMRLWMHECRRVFADRLVSPPEVNHFNEILADISKKRFTEVDVEELHEEPIIFTSFATPTFDDTPVYLPAKSTASLKEVLQAKLDDYNEGHPIMELVLFNQAMEHVTRVTRIIESPGGNALLVGVGGSGKQSLSKLAAHICSCDVFQLAITSTYGIPELKEDLKELYRKAGVKPGLPLIFMLTDSQIVDEKFLVYVNDLLSSGYIPDLFTIDEYDSILGALRNQAKAAGIPDARDQMMEFFIERVRANLHVILCLSPVGAQFRARARKFPGLINCTAIDWFHPWPLEALVSVGQRFLEGVDVDPDVLENVTHHLAEANLAVTKTSEEFLQVQGRYNYTTPKTYLELITFYRTLLAEKQGKLKANIERLSSGVTTLRKTATDVAGLQDELKVKMVAVNEKRAEADKILDAMGKERAEAEAQQAIADVEAKKANEATEIAAKIESEAQAELDVARPALDAAKDAVACLSKASLTELKGMTKPPAGVDRVTTAVLMLLKHEKKDFSWDNAKKMMAKVDQFKAKLENFAAGDIPENFVKLVEAIIAEPGFTADKMKQKSQAAANLCVWVINTILYHKVFIKVKPLMDKLDAAQATKAAAEADLAKVMEQVAVIQGRLDDLQQTFLVATNEKAKVEAVASECEGRLNLAERLVTGLSSENERWGREIDRMKAETVTQAGDVLLAASFVSYVGAFDSSFRKKLWRDLWITDLVSREVPMTPDIDPLQVLATDGEVASWMNDGLPADRVSIENGAIITSCKRWPLLIDPQLQGIKWLRRREESRMERLAQSGRGASGGEDKGEGDEGGAGDVAEGDAGEGSEAGEGSGDASSLAPELVVLQVTQRGWLRSLINAITEGCPVIIENLGEDIDAVLDPVLSRAVYRKGRQLFLNLGGEEVEYDSDFRLYLQTKLANPHFKPELAAQCTLINFIVTERGLEEQLLARVVQLEQPELESQKQELQQAFNRYQIQLVQLEDDLLESLANAPDDILSDVPLIEGLEATKRTATDIDAAVEKGKKTEIIINESREVYRPVAAEGAMLYFILIQLHRIEHMYQYSLDAFLVFFVKAMRKTEAKELQDERVEALRRSVRLTVCTWVQRGLFEKHKLIFLTQMLFSLMQREVVGSDSGFGPKYLSFLLRGPMKAEGENPIEWLPESSWNACQALIELEGFESFASDLEENAPRFLEWYNHATPETEKLPLDWRELERTPFLKLLVVRCMRPDRLTAAVTTFINDLLPSGTMFTECDGEMNSYQVLELSYVDSGPLTPLYFILSPGANITADIDRLAAKMGMVEGDTYHNVSLGQGQDVVAMDKLSTGRKAGHWVVLHNVHLMPRWLNELNKLLDKLENTETLKPNEQFRIMLSSDAAKSIPFGLLERAIKLTNEPPSGLKANLKRAFCSFERDEYEDMEPRTKGILFGLCHFHAIMLERKKFGSLGYNMMYPFAVGDLLCSAVVLRNYMDNAPSKIPWDDLRYLFGEIMYGGHIVNDYDRLVANTYLEFFLRDDLLDEMLLYPYNDDRKQKFSSPKTSNSYDRVLEHIDTELKNETPLAYGLHPNAEIGFRTNQANVLFGTVLSLQPRDASVGESGEEGGGPENVLQDIMDQVRDATFDCMEIAESMEDGIGPFQNVFLQECDRMNVLVQEMLRSLHELELGLKGDLTMSDVMERLSDALQQDQVPATWAKLACPSMRTLAMWLVDLQGRLQQLQDWTSNPLEIPPTTWLPGIFNPQSFLTAIMQTTAQTNNLELNKLAIVTDPTKKIAEAIDTPAREGCYVHGFSVEGGHWDTQSGNLELSKPREMFCPMPVINCRAVPSDEAEQNNCYMCPVYRTRQRGPTYIFTANLRTKAPRPKWVLGGVCMILDTA